MFFETNRAPSYYPPPSSTIYTDKRQQPILEPLKIMATEFAMPVPQFTTSPSQYTLYNSQSQPISPVHSGTATPNNVSPTSPRLAQHPAHLPAHTRQLRPPKSPLYVPAVLRPTDPPKRARISPPQSMHGSFEDLGDSRALSRRGTEDSGKFGLGAIEEIECSAEGLGKVTASPTKNHWKPDSASQICDDATCTKSFTLVNRKHHCRRCGNIFCGAHSPHKIPLDQDANYHPKGQYVRACTHCSMDYRRWSIARSSRSNSETSDEAPATPTVDCMGGKIGKGNAVGGGLFGGRAESLAQSVPRDWHWSTF